MKSRKAVEETIRTKLNHTLDLPLRGQLLARALREQKQSQETEPAIDRPAIRRMIMKNSIVKLGIAAVVIAVVGIGIAEFLGTGSTSGVAWAEVARKVDASQGVIFRLRTTGSKDTNDDWPNAYRMTRRSARYSRTDWYRGDQAKSTVRFDLDTRNALWLSHDAKTYFTKALSEGDVQSLQSEWTDPKDFLDLLMSHEYQELGRKTIDGMVCEGIEVTDPAAAGANFPIKSFVGRMWVSVETGYPVLGEMEITRGDQNPLRQTQTVDQFRWDVEIGPNEIDVAIPSDYRLMD